MTAPAAAETQVSISASDNSVDIGDQVNLKILVKTNTETQEIKVKTGENAFEIIRQQNTVKTPQKEYMVFEKSITIAFFKVGDFNIGPFTIELLKDGKTVETKETNSIPITVKSVLKQEDKDIKGLKDLIDIKGNPFYILKYVILALAIVLLLVFVAAWLKKRKKAPEAPPKPLLSPVEEFELLVNELWGKGLFDKGKVKLHFIELTVIIKRFLFRNYGFNAEDLTTYETVYYLKKRERELVIPDNMQYVLDISDLAKFAKYIPDLPLMGELFDKIKHTIDIYKRRIQAQINNQDKPR
jgi:hypothetical protein